MFDFFDKQEQEPTLKGFMGMIALLPTSSALGYVLGLITSVL